MNQSPISTVSDRSPDIRARNPQSWEMHVGTVHLFIVGPGSNSMWPVAGPYYRGQVGTDNERRIARAAVVILGREHRDNNEPTLELVMEAMERAAKGYLPKPEKDPEPEPPPQKPGRLILGEWEKRWQRRYDGFVHRKTGVVAKSTEERNAFDLAAGDVRYATPEDNLRAGNARRGRVGQWESLKDGAATPATRRKIGNRATKSRKNAPVLARPDEGRP